MDRSGWLRERRRATEERMDTLFAPIYDEHWGGSIESSHQRMMDRFLSLCPPGCTVLDAACGTGKYWSLILESGRLVQGIDDSREMLARATAKFPGVPVVKMGLQEMAYCDLFDGILCVDAMEFVFPEDWPTVLGNFHRALRPGGPLYFTVELEDEQAIGEAYRAGREMGWPLLPGEWILEGGYHYYPSLEQVRDWVAGARFGILEEETGDGYQHFLVQKAGD